MRQTGFPRPWIILGLLFLAACHVDADKSVARDDYVDTPFGRVPRECYRQHPAGTTLRQIANGVQALHADGTTRDYVSTERCIALGKTLGRRQEAVGTFPVANGWFNYASWTSPQNVGTFTATYQLPNLPKIAAAQHVYYFIGVQSFQTATGPETILQPVIGYNQIGGKGWTLSSWNCCPSGQVHQGNVVTGMGPQDIITASVAQTIQSPPTYAISGVWGGQTASLNVVTNGEVLTWPNVTLEAYNVLACNQFMVGPFTFSQLAMTGVNGQRMTPRWAISPPSNPAPCNTKLLVNGSTITIQENIPP
jgi:hypothetical protein